MKAIIIRLAEEQDLDTLCTLYFYFHEFHAHHLSTYLRTLDYPSEKEQEELKCKIKELIQGGDSAVLVADCEGQVLGLAEVYLKHTGLDNRAIVSLNYAHLQSLMVAQDFRGKGIGSQLIKSVEAWARERGAVELRLDTWEFSAGPLGFYDKLGYQTIRRTLAKKL